MFNKGSGMITCVMGFVLMLACTQLNLINGRPRLALACEIIAGLNAAMFLLWLTKPGR